MRDCSGKFFVIRKYWNKLSAPLLYVVRTKYSIRSAIQLRCSHFSVHTFCILAASLTLEAHNLCNIKWCVLGDVVVFIGFFKVNELHLLNIFSCFIYIFSTQIEICMKYLFRKFN